MVKSTKKRSVSETEEVGKKIEATGNLTKVFKKNKTENKTLQNGQANKQVEKNVPKNVKAGMKKTKDVEVIQSSNKKDSYVTSKKHEKQTLDNKENQSKSLEGVKTNKKKKGLKDFDLSADELKEKIEEINSRDTCSRTARRKLGLLKKLLRVKEGTDAQQQPQKNKKKNQLKDVRNKQIQNKEQNKKLQEKSETKLIKQNKQKNTKRANQLVIKKQKEDEEEDEDEESEMDVELSEDESDAREEEIEEEEIEEEEIESEEVADEEEENGDNDENDEEENKNNAVKTNNIQISKQKERNENGEETKKRKYILFVGNLPHNITSEQVKEHFLTKVSQVVNVEIPMKDANTAHGFAFVEVANDTDFKNSFSLHQSIIAGRTIKVQFYKPKNRKGGPKNVKSHTFQKERKFGNGKNRPFQKNFSNKKK